MVMLTFFAHADEFHTETTTETEHILTEWYVIVPLFLLVLVAVLWSLRYFFKAKPPVLLFVTLGLCLSTGVLAAATIPALSAVAITIGMAISLFLLVATLSHRK